MQLGDNPLVSCSSRSLRSVAVASVLSLLPACTKTRTANTGWMFGVTAGPTSATDVYSGAIGGVTTKGAVAETEEHVTVYARGDAALGGNVRGVAGQLALQVEAGAAAFDGPHHLFARGGFTGTLERDPYTGFFAIEAPVATVGYQFHGQGTSTFADGTHFDVGLRGGLLAAGRVFAATRQIDLVGDPELGPVVVLMGDGVNLRFEYAAVFAEELLHLGRASACFEAFFALCVDTRQILTHVDTASGRRDVHTSVFGIAFGAGLATGYEYD
jgi:hypothetical protein